MGSTVVETTSEKLQRCGVCHQMKALSNAFACTDCYRREVHDIDQIEVLRLKDIVDEIHTKCFDFGQYLTSNEKRIALECAEKLTLIVRLQS